MKTPETGQGERGAGTCAVNSSFNFIVGGVATAVAIAIGYVAWRWIW